MVGDRRIGVRHDLHTIFLFFIFKLVGYENAVENPKEGIYIASNCARSPVCIDYMGSVFLHWRSVIFNQCYFYFFCLFLHFRSVTIISIHTGELETDLSL